MTDAFETIASELLTGGTGVRFRAEGDSMYPTIRTGELITVVPVNIERICRGDILLVRRTDRTVAHRVVSVATGRDGKPVLSVQGDRASVPDPPISTDSVLGLVQSVERGGREVALRRWYPAGVRLLVRGGLRVRAVIRGRRRS